MTRTSGKTAGRLVRVEHTSRVLADNPLAEYHDDYNWGFITTEKMTTTLYRALTSE